MRSQSCSPSTDPMQIGHRSRGSGSRARAAEPCSNQDFSAGTVVWNSDVIVSAGDLRPRTSEIAHDHWPPRQLLQRTAVTKRAREHSTPLATIRKLAGELTGCSIGTPTGIGRIRSPWSRMTSRVSAQASRRLHRRDREARVGPAVGAMTMTTTSSGPSTGHSPGSTANVRTPRGIAGRGRRLHDGSRTDAARRPARCLADWLSARRLSLIR